MDVCEISGAVMDTADRYELTKARDILTRQYGRKITAQILFQAKMTGSYTTGGTKVTCAGGLFTITDA